MQFAEVPISVPAYFPDLIVTSYIRSDGSHATGNAIDIAPFGSQLSKYGREKGSMYWMYYFSIIDLLWLRQRTGRIRMAAPPYCPHYHIDLTPKSPVAGVEYVKPDARGNCKYINHFEVDNRTSAQRDAFVEAWREHFVNEWRPSNAAVIAENWKKFFSQDEKKLRVYTNKSKTGEPYISQADLQSKIDLLFGTGSNTQLFLDSTAQVFGYANADDAKKGAQTWFNLALLGAGAWGVYLLAKEARWWDLNKKDRKL